MATSRGIQLAQEIRRNVATLKQVCDGIDENMATRVPTDRWSPKQILSHLCGPDDAGQLPILKRFIDSDAPEVEIVIENPFFSEKRARMSFRDLVAKCETNYERIADFTAERTEEQLARKAHVPMLKGSPLGEYPTLDGMITLLGGYHLQVHTDQLREFLTAPSTE